MLYEAYQAHADALWPLRHLGRTASPALSERSHALADAWGRRHLAAACEVFNLAEVRHRRPDWGIDEVVTDAGVVGIEEEVVLATPFGTLRRFRKSTTTRGPRVLLVAPMSGHFATLLRDTVRTMLEDHDVYVTDWHNARDIPLREGRFGLDEYTEHIMQFMAAIGPGAHLMAICQPCVSALAATALMSEDDHPSTPASLTLMAGPIDCRVNPTEVNRLATARPIDWFEQHLIACVPWRYPGAGRRVYPGFVQLSAFMSMNRERHVNAFRDYFQHLVADEHEKAQATRSFYEEYLAVADLPSDFYLETVAQVFQQHALPRGELRFRDRRIDPSAIRRTALLTIEGERDDICAIGQTLAAQDLCSRVRPYLRTHHVQPGVGHYGVFSGKRWQRHIYPVVRDVIHLSA